MQPISFRRALIFLTGISALLILAALFKSQAGRVVAAPPVQRLGVATRARVDASSVFVWPDHFEVTHNPAPQTTIEEMMIENLSMQPRSFSITESAAVCGEPSELSWVGAQPTSGILPLKGARIVNLTFNSTGLANGLYSGMLCVQTNDPQTPMIPVSVSLRVGPLSTATATRTHTPVPPTATRTPTRTQTPAPGATLTPTTVPTFTRTPTRTPTRTNTPPPGATLTPTSTAATQSPTVTPPAAYERYLPIVRRR